MICAEFQKITTTKIITIMTIKNIENQGYVAPEMQAIEICSEGLLCVSGELDAQNWKAGNSNWFEEE